MEFGVTGMTLNWLQSNLIDRRHYVKLGHYCSATVSGSTGVPQGLVLGPLLFADYVSPVGDLVKSHGVDHHQYADDSQLFLSMKASSMTADLLKLQSCAQAVKAWFAESKLLLNANKSDVMCVGTSAQLYATKHTMSIVVAGANLHPTDELKSLGVILDSHLTFAAHALAVRKECNYHIRVLRHIRHLLTLDVVKNLACSIVGALLDYCNSILHGAPESTLSKLQRVQNTLARVVLQQPKHTHVEPLLHTFHWLPVKQRIHYKLATLTHKIRAISTPHYLSELILPRIMGTRMSLQSAPCILLRIPSTRTVFHCMRTGGVEQFT